MANRKSRNDGWKTAGMAALILLAPGGFILGFTLMASAAADLRLGRKGSERPNVKRPTTENPEGANQVLVSPAVDATSPKRAQAAQSKGTKGLRLRLWPPNAG